jgi:hypothetical protein
MKQPGKQFALCIDNAGNEASLILGKVYRIVLDAKAAKDRLVRIIDESGKTTFSTRISLCLSISQPRSKRRFSRFRTPAEAAAEGLAWTAGAVGEAQARQRAS